ncbi:MAG: hypothetical protein M3N46_12235 [Actinomycetota bacterium]|nr:hypothetical protein [Actinomycetota bacterium]
MPDSITKAITRPGLVPAFFAGLGVFLLLLGIASLQSLFTTLSVISGTSAAGDYAGQILATQLLASGAGPLPFSIGVFLSFWQLAPIAPKLRLAHVVTRSLLATLIGGLLLWIVFVLAQLITDLVSPPAGGTIHALGSFGPDVLTALLRALAAILGYLPSVALAGILLWGWLQRHPQAKRVHGVLDEV